jgi:hypothetical protein
MAVAHWYLAAMPEKAPPTKPAPLTSPAIKHHAGEGLKHPSMLTTEEVRALAASVMEHIQRKK